MSSHVVAQLGEDRLGVLAVLGRPAQLGRLPIELHRHCGQPVGGPALDPDVADVAVRLHLWVVEQIGDRLHRCPRGVDAAQQRLPLGEGPSGELLVQQGDALGAVLARRAAMSAKRGSSASSARPMSRQKSAQ